MVISNPSTQEQERESERKISGMTTYLRWGLVIFTTNQRVHVKEYEREMIDYLMLQ